MDEKTRTRLDLHRDNICSRAIYSLCLNLGAAMSNFKFKRGDIVEIIKSKRGNNGHRFMVGNFDVRDLLSISGLILRSNCNSYETDIKANSNISVFTWTGEDNLKLINPDIDKISEFKFAELMDEITEAITVEQ